MIAGKKVLALIPARGGSKGIPRKNIHPVAGKPLLAWTIESALKSGLVDQVIVSTEDAEIAEVARKYGAEVPFMRPAHLASDASSGMDPVFHAIDELKFDGVVVLLQPTSPLRTAEDIDGALKFYAENSAAPVLSVSAVSEHPEWIYRMDAQSTLAPYTGTESKVSRRQDLEPLFTPNGAVYVADVSTLRREKTFSSPQARGYVMPGDRSADVDTLTDLRFCEFLLTQKK